MSLNKRTKCFRDQRSFEVDDLVLTHQNNIPRSHYPLGRITKFFLSNENVVRSVEVKLPNSLLVCPAES